MLHAYSYTIYFEFCYTSWRFYAFFGTNLLTRCHTASSLFSAILCFRKVTQEIFLELDETKAEPLIRLKRIYKFLCSMLVFTPFAYCFVTLHGTFMRFPELTYWQDATVPVPCFLLFLCFRKVTQEIFSELDETSSRSLIFPGSFPKTEREPEGGQRPPCRGNLETVAMGRLIGGARRWWRWVRLGIVPTETPRFTQVQGPPGWR
jgi:hypothetical protein